MDFAWYPPEFTRIKLPLNIIKSNYVWWVFSLIKHLLFFFHPSTSHHISLMTLATENSLLTDPVELTFTQIVTPLQLQFNSSFSIQFKFTIFVTLFSSIVKRNSDNSKWFDLYQHWCIPTVQFHSIVQKSDKSNQWIELCTAMVYTCTIPFNCSKKW